MQLEFETWLNSQRFSTATCELFNEAILCYKASAYKAALLFSYVAFLTIVKERLLKSKKPIAVHENAWEQLQRELLDDDKWEHKAFDATQLTKQGGYFRCSDDVRNQVRYWKDRRNDCAHSKSNAIGISHVDAFWLFIKSNLAKFIIDGGIEGLLNEIRDHFDRSVTPSNTDPFPIIQKIPSAIEPREIPYFLEEVNRIISNKFARATSCRYSEDAVKFVAAFFRLQNAEVLEHLIPLLKQDKELFVRLMVYQEGGLQYFGDDPQFVRKLWYDYLPSQQPFQVFPIYVALLRNGYIPVDQLTEAHEKIIRNVVCSPPPNPESFRTLQDSGFFDVFKRIVFEDNLLQSWGWTNSNVEIILFYIKNFGIDEIISGCIWEVYEAQHHPFDLREPLVALFNENQELASEFQGLLDSCGRSWPRFLKPFS